MMMSFILSTSKYPSKTNEKSLLQLAKFYKTTSIYLI